MTTVTGDEILAAFQGAGLSSMNKKMLSRCTALATNHHLTAKALADCWEAFSINKNIQELEEHSWSSFQNAVLKEADTRAATEPLKKTAVKVEPGLGKRQVGVPLVTPPAKRVNRAPDQVTSAVDAIAVKSEDSPASTYTPPKYGERDGASKVILTFNPNDLKPTTDQAPNLSQPKCEINHQRFDTNVQKPYRHLFTTMDDRAKALDQQLVRMEDILMERFNIGKEANEGCNENAIAPLEAVGIPRQEKICCIGRICNAAHEGRINSTSVVLEGSKHMGGARIEMDLTHLQDEKQDYSLFPGQVVAVEGVNSTGRKLTAHRICEGAAQGTPKTPAKQLLEYHHYEQYQNGHPLKVMAVAGPYTTSDNLDYDPLIDFLGHVMLENPDVVIMVGPFVDMRHKDIQSGNVVVPDPKGGSLSLTFESLFAERISGNLDQIIRDNADLKTQFILVPSLDDATAEFAYPQAPFQNRLFGKGRKHWKDANVDVGTLELAGLVGGKNPRVHCVSNPCTFQLNEIVVGVTGTDTIFHMSGDETNGNLVPGSRLARISQHMLQQQSYYPLFPPASGTNLDLKHMKQWAMPVQPDLLIVPSKLTSFARPVLDTVVLNPGQLSKNTTGGTFSVMEIHPMKREDLENAGDEVELDHSISERLRLEIKKI